MEAALEGKKGQRGETKSASGCCCCCCCGVRESAAEEGLGYVKVELDGELDRNMEAHLVFFSIILFLFLFYLASAISCIG